LLFAFCFLLFAFCFLLFVLRSLTPRTHGRVMDALARPHNAFLCGCLATADRLSASLSFCSFALLLFCSFARLLVCSFARLLVCSFARLLSIDYRVEGQLDGLSLLLLLLVAPLPHLRISFWWPAASPLHGPRRNRRLALVLLSNLAELPRALGMLLAD
jgi:hypothetical protein